MRTRTRSSGGEDSALGRGTGAEPDGAPGTQECGAPLGGVEAAQIGDAVFGNDDLDVVARVLTGAVSRSTSVDCPPCVVGNAMMLRPPGEEVAAIAKSGWPPTPPTLAPSTLSTLT